MKIPEKITTVECFYLTDGGSIVLVVEQPNGTRHQITLAQHLFLETFDPNRLPGRLYFDHLIVPVRSEMEARLIALLQASEIVPAEPPEPKNNGAPFGDGLGVIVGDDLKEYYAKAAEGKGEALQHLIENLILFVQSSEYVSIAKKFERGGNGG